MATILLKNKGSTRQTPSIDFTPMVDLGFLLITFFMLTTALTKPVVMSLVMPDDDGNPDPLKASKALTLIPAAENKLYWYEGVWNGNLNHTDWSGEGLRRLILEKKERVNAQWGQEVIRSNGSEKLGSSLYVLIKPTANARYENLVDLLDEMAICQVRYYSVLNISQPENTTIESGLNQ